MAPSRILEVVVFTLKPDVDSATFMQANAALMPELRTMPGFVGREILATAGGQWPDMVRGAPLMN